MNCKCGAGSFEGHAAKVAAGYPAHVYSGFFWAADRSQPGRDTEQTKGDT